MQIRIKGYSFDIGEPFQEGAILSAAEAKALNTLRAENIQNNKRSAVAKAVEGLAPGALLSREALAALQHEITQYDQRYSFTEIRPRTRLGDIEQEALAIAQALVELELERVGRVVAVEDLARLVEERARLPAVIEAARERVAAQRLAISGGIDML